MSKPLLIAIGSMGVAIILVLMILAFIIFKKRNIGIVFLLELIGFEAVLISMLYFNVSIAPIEKIENLLFISNSEVISKVNIKEMTIEIVQDGKCEELNYAVIDNQTIKFISPINEKEYYCYVEENNLMFWTNTDLKLQIYSDDEETINFQQI